MNNKYVRIVTKALLVFCVFLQLSSCQPKKNEGQNIQFVYSPKQYIAVKSNSQFIIDGILSDTEWKDIEWSDSFGDIEGNNSKNAPPTKMKMAWADSGLFIAAWLLESHLWATLTEDESVIYHDNDFEIFIDPNKDTHDYYEFEINAYGTKWDLKMNKPYKNGGRNDDSFTFSGLQSAVHTLGTINKPTDLDSCWTIEVYIPWKAFPENNIIELPGKDPWKMNFSRVQWDVNATHFGYEKQKDSTGKVLPEHNYTWSPQGIINMHFPERWGLVYFREKGIETVPSLDEGDSLHAIMRDWYQTMLRIKKQNGTYPTHLTTIGVPDSLQKNIHLKVTNEEFSIHWKVGNITYTLESNSKFYKE